MRCVEENGEFVVEFEGQWFRTVDDFFKKAEIDGKLLTDIQRHIEYFDLEEGG